MEESEHRLPTPRSWIHPTDAARYHHAARMLDDDHEGAYFTTRQKYGPDVAAAVLIAILRAKLNKNPGQWPPPEDLEEKVNNYLRDKGLMEH